MARAVDNCQTSVRANEKERDLSEERNLLNCDIQLDGLTLGTEGGSSGRPLLNSAKLELLKGNHYGLIGRNGVGKTTLLKMIHQHKINGMWKHLRTVYVDDQAAVDAKTNPEVVCLDFLLSAHTERLSLTQQLAKMLEVGDNEEGGAEAEMDLDMLEKVHDQLRLLGADAAKSRAIKILKGLFLDPTQAVGTLSGGWLHRLALASALFMEADILLLDEPTNHLDLKALQWLQGFLIRSSSTVVVVSHDSAFLNHVTDHIITFEEQALTYYKGNFARFLETRAAKLEKHKRMFTAQETRRRQIEKTLENIEKRANRGDESCDRQIRSRKKTLNGRLGASLNGVYWKYGRMGPRPEILAPLEEEPFEFTLETDVSDTPDCDAPSKGGAKAGGGGAVLIASDLGFTWPKCDSILFDRVTLRLGVGTRLALVGANGSGKTTFLRVLQGKIKPSRGSIMTWDGLRVGSFEQDAVALLSEVKGETAMTWLIKKHKDLWGGAGSVQAEKKARKLLAGLGLTGTVVEEQPLGTLSNGQRSRVLLADVIAEEPHLLFLDEPSNHLDAESHAALVSALEYFEGGIIIATHDQVLSQELDCDYLCFLGSPEGVLKVVDDYDKYLDLAGIPKEWSDAADPEVTSGEAKSAKQAKIDFKRQKKEEDQRQAAAVGAGKREEEADKEGPKPVDGPRLKGGIKEAKSVGCRHCGGSHFSHSCPNKAEMDQESNKKKEAQQAQAKKLPPTKEKAKDGGNDWKVAVTKSTMKRMQKGK